MVRTNHGDMVDIMAMLTPTVIKDARRVPNGSLGLLLLFQPVELFVVIGNIQEDDDANGDEAVVEVAADRNPNRRHSGLMHTPYKIIPMN